MRYLHVLAAFVAEYWAMEPAKLAAIAEFLTLQADGVKFDAAEVEARISPATAAAVARREGAIAVVPLRGIIANRLNLTPNTSGGGGMSAEGFSATMEAAIRDDGVKAVVMDVDSVGGTVAGVEEAAAVVMSLRGSKPIVAQVNATCASAAYWIASAADEIVVTPTGRVGSIGVRTAHDDMTAALEKQGIARTHLAAGKFKGEGLLGPLGDETREYMQREIEGYYRMFTDRVALGRGVTGDQVRSGFGEGRMVSAQQAVREGMADRVGVMSETLTRFGAGSSAPSAGGSRARRERALALL